MSKKRNKTERDKMADHCRMLTKLLMYEVSGGIIPLPKGVDAYAPPAIPFAERRAFLDSVNKSLLIDMKVNPDSEVSVFDSLKEELHGKRNAKTADRGDSGKASDKWDDGAAGDDEADTTDIFGGDIP